MRQLSPCSPQTIADELALYLGSSACLLDVGCGRGDMLDWLSRHTGYSLYGAEPDSGMLERAKSACPSAELIQAEAADLPFGNGFFDAILLECVFSLVDDPNAVIAEMHRLLKQGGVLLLADLYTKTYWDVFLEWRPLVGWLYTKERMEAFYLGNRCFALSRFVDCTDDLLTFVAQEIMDGCSFTCSDEDAFGRLRKEKAGYGMWVFTKNERDLLKGI